METYRIEVKEVLSRVVEIEANSIDDAVDKVEEMYRNEDIVLDYSDFVRIDFDLESYAGIPITPDFANFILRKAEESLGDLSIEELALIGFESQKYALSEFQK